MDTELPSPSIFNDPALLMFMQTLEQVSSQQQQQQQSYPQQQQQQEQQQEQQQQTQQATTLEQILQQVQIIQAIQELAAQQQQQSTPPVDTQMMQEEDEEDALSNQNSLDQNSGQHQKGIHQLASGNQRSFSPPQYSQPLNLVSSQQYKNQEMKIDECQNNILAQNNNLKLDKQEDIQQNNRNNNSLLSPSLTSVNLSHNQENTQYTSKGRAKRDTSSTIRIQQQSSSQMEAPPTPSQLPIIPEIIIPTASSFVKSNTNNNISNIANTNSSNNNHSSVNTANNFNFDFDSFNIGINANSANNMNDNNNSSQEEIQLMNLLSSCFSIEQLVQLVLASGNGQNMDNAQATAAALTLIMSNGNNSNGCPNNSNFVDTLNNDSGEENGQNQYSKYQHLMNTPTSSNAFNSNNKTGLHTSNGTSKTQQSHNFSGNSANHQSSSNGNNNQNIFHNITTNLSSFFDMSGFNSGEKKALSPTSSRQTTSFIPHIISHSNGINNGNQQQLPVQQLNFSQMGNILNSIDPTTLSFQALMAQHGGIDTPDIMRLREQKRLERQFKIERYKNKRRNWIRKISYDCRKRVADSRLRIKGRFISKKDSEKLKQRPDDSSYQQENMMAVEQPSQNESNNKQEGQDSQIMNGRYMNDMMNIDNNREDKQFQSHMHQNQQQNPENTESDEPNISPQKGYEMQTAPSQSNLENNQNPTEEINNQNICELTCAAAMNPNNIISSHFIKPDIMEKVKQRISEKKPLFALINPETPSRLVMELQHQYTSSSISTSSSSSSTSSKVVPIADNTKNTNISIDHTSYQAEQKQLIEA